MSKGLDAFNALGSAFLMKCKDYKNNSCKVLNTNTGEMYSPQELTEIVRKELKALEIIREKKVFVANLIYHFETDNNVIEYNRECGWAKSELTQEEYDLLKEVLYGKKTS